MVQQIINIIRKAGEEVNKIYLSSKGFNTEIKKDGSPITDADKKSNDGAPEKSPFL